MAAPDPVPTLRPRTRRRRASATLFVGLALFALLLVGNVAAFLLPDERDRLDVRFEPPQIAWLGDLLTRAQVRDTVMSAAANAFDLQLTTPAPPPAVVFRSRPTPTARIGRRYSYKPQTAVPVAGYSLDGAVPPGLAVDPQTGEITGTPAERGTFAVVLRGQLQSGQTAEQRFNLYVDDRSLPLGSDDHGRNVLTRLIATLKFTILPGSVAVLVSVIGGALLGALGGFYSGFASRVVQGATMVVQTIPGLLAIFFAAVLSEFNVYVIMVVAGLIQLPETANGVLGKVKSFRERDFVEAARELGMPDRIILWNEIVWHNARSFLLTRVTQGFIFAIIVEVTVSYVGLADLNTARLGQMMLAGRNVTRGAHIFDQTGLFALAPLIVLLLVITTFSLTERGVLSLWERRR